MESQIQQLKHKDPDQLAVGLHCAHRSQILLSFSFHFSVKMPLIVGDGCTDLGELTLGRNGSVQGILTGSQQVAYMINFECIDDSTPTTTIDPTFTIDPITTTTTKTTTTDGI